MGDIRKIIVIGGTGFTGSQVVRQLEEIENIEVTCLVRSLERKPNWNGACRFNVVQGDLENLSDLISAFEGHDALIFVASMGFGHMPNVVKACASNKIKRAVFTSSTAIFTRLPAQSKDGREKGEEQVVNSGLDWTLLRPTMIFGRKGDRNIERLVKNLKRFPIFFIPGSGQAMQQPIYVDDVAKAVIDALWSSNTICKAYNISGNEPLTFKEMVRQTARALKRKVIIINLPLLPIRQLIKMYCLFTKKPKISDEQILRLNENKAFDHEEAHRDFGFTPASFDGVIENLIKEIS